MWGIPREGEIDYSVELELDLASVQPGVAGPKRPQDRINLPDLKEAFLEFLGKPTGDGGYGKEPGEMKEHYDVRLQWRRRTRTTRGCHRPTRVGIAAAGWRTDDRAGDGEQPSDARRDGGFDVGSVCRWARARSATAAC